MSILKRNITITATIFASIAAMAVAAVAQSGESSPGDGFPQVTTVDESAQQAMEVLDEPRGPSDAMPANVAESIDESAKFGMNPDLSRESIDTLSNDVHVIPAADHICSSLTVGDGVNLSCAETSDVAAGKVGPTTVTLGGGAIAIYGIVPDGVASVTFSTGPSSTSTVQTNDNAYFTAVPAGTVLRSLSYTGPSGVVEFPLYDPKLAFEE